MKKLSKEYHKHPNDFEIGNRHNLERILVMNEAAVMNENAPAKYQGMSRYECRKQLVDDLKADGYLDHIDDHVHNVGYNTRSGEIIEPYLSKQWFIDIKMTGFTGGNLIQWFKSENNYKKVLKNFLA